MVHISDIATQVQWQDSRFVPLDDYPTHQIARPFSASGGGEPEWFEHDVAYLIPPMDAGRPYLLNWFQFKPNLDRLQSWTMLNDTQTQYNFVMSRPIGQRRAAMDLGPLKFEILDPGSRYRVRLAPDADLPFSFQYELSARSPVKLWDRRSYPDTASSFHVEHCVTNQALTVTEGHVTVGDRTFDVSGNFGFRDHCWGRRSGPHVDRGFHTPTFAQFADFSLALWYEELVDGTPLYAVGHVTHDGTGETTKFVEFEHDWTFEAGTNDSLTQSWRLVDEHGEEHELSARRLVRGGFQRYSETSGERLHHSGAVPVARPGLLNWSLQEIDLTDETVLSSAWALEQRQQHCEFTFDGETGHGVVMPYVSPRHVRYGSQLTA